MKKKLVLLTIILFAQANVFSQNKEFIVGVLVGFYGVHIQGDIDEVYSPTNGDFYGTGGLSGGFNVKRYFSKTVYGEFEIRYIRKGSIYDFVTDYGIQAFESIRLDYIELPLLVGFKINFKKKYLLIETGLAYGRKVYSRMEISDLNQWNYDNILNNFTDNDYSWIATLKYPIIKSKKLLLGFRFSHSLVSIHKLYKLYNMDYGVEVYYLFNRNVDRLK